MKKAKNILLSGCMMLSAAAFAQQAIKPNLSVMTKRYLHEIAKHPKQGKMGGYIYNTGADGTTYISALIKVADAEQAQSGLDAIHAHVGTKAGKVWTVKLPVDQVLPFTSLSGLSYIQLDEPVYPTLDVARKTTKVDSVQGGYGLPMAYSGKDVVVGVIDFGFDYNHPTFYDTARGRYRIKKVWQMNGFSAPPAGYSYGKEISDSNAIRTEGTDDVHQNHGTCTSGMAAGSGYGSTATSARRFRGMAYDADLVMVGVRRDFIEGEWQEGSFSDFLDGVNYIFGYATQVGKPAVTNISWGSQSGSHDGTSLFNEACNEMSGPGRIISMSAGNEGQENLHLSKTFTATDTVIKTFITYSPADYRRTWVDIWGQPGKTFCAKATLYSGGVAGATTQYKCIDGGVTDMYLINANGTDTCYVQFLTSYAEGNGKPRLMVSIFNKGTDTVGISINGTSGSIDVWNEYYYYGFPHHYQSAFDALGQSDAVSGNTNVTVSDMGSAKSVLLVGAYVSKGGFTNINGQSLGYSVTVGGLAPFSSHGPMVDGRIKPDIAAPGMTVATSMSSYDTSYTETGSNGDLVIRKFADPVSSKNYYYSEFSGTSASAPAASGIVALLLQADPGLSPDSLKAALFETAITDAITGTIPAAGNNTWGHGKINAYKAIKRVVRSTGVYNVSGKAVDCVLYPNPNDGNFAIDVTADKAEPLMVSVYDMQGKLLLMKEWTVSRGQNREAFTLPGAAKGVYVVKVTSSAGSVSIRTMIK